MKAEVQLRTVPVDSRASPEHQIRYKKGIESDGAMSEEMKHCALLRAEPDGKMNGLRGTINEKASENKEDSV